MSDRNNKRLLEKLGGKHFDVGICGVWYGLNYGSILTYYALYRTIKKLGYSVLMISKTDMGREDIEKDSRTYAGIFAENHYEAVAPSLTPEEMPLLNDYCDTFLMGCDQVWNYGIARGSGLNFYLDFAADDKRKISYASSFGHGTSFTPMERLSEIARLFHRFDAISVREAEAVKVLDNEFGVQGTQVLDPVFLLENADYQEIFKECNKQTEEEKYLLAYILDPTPEIREGLLYASEKLGLKLVAMLDGRGDFRKNKEILNIPHIVEHVDAPTWLWYFKNAEFVITDSCHGASFSLIFRKSFVCIANKRRGVSRFESLVDLFQIRDRFIYDAGKLKVETDLFRPMDYSRIDEIMEMEQKRSIKWLKEALSKPKKDYTNITCVAPKECCGCGACFNSCPVDAIRMEYDKEGFLYPRIDEKKCIHCQKCIKACPSLNPYKGNEKEPECYAAYGSDEIRMKSSSGGIFPIVADQILKSGGIVCGAAYDEKFQVVQQVISSERDLGKLRGSKYVQSNTLTTYKQIKKELDKGKEALYVGCPCQIAGLRSFLGKDYEKLFTIDLLCHGGPSPKVFEKYLREVHGDKEVEYVGFRDKDAFLWGINATGMTVRYKDGSVYRKAKWEDPFYRAFTKSLISRPHCDVCNYATLPRQGDLTLGDFWGVEKYNPEWKDEKGTSIISVNNEKGKKMCEALRGQLKFIKKIDRSYIITHGQPYAKPCKGNSRRNQFMKLLQRCTFAKAFECTEKNVFDFGLVGMNADSYGEILRCYALYQKISKLGFSTLIIKRPYEMESDISPLKYQMDKFAESFYPIVSRHSRMREFHYFGSTCRNYVLCDSKNMYEELLEKNRGSIYKGPAEVDPLLFLSHADCCEIIRKSTARVKGRYIAVYFSEEGVDRIEKYREYAREHQMSLIDLADDYSIEDWLACLQRAECLVTDQKDGITMAVLLKVKIFVETSKSDVKEYAKTLGISVDVLPESMETATVSIGSYSKSAYEKLKFQGDTEEKELTIHLEKMYRDQKKRETGRRAMERMLRSIKRNTPIWLKEKIFPVIRKNKFYNRYVKHL